MVEKNPKVIEYELTDQEHQEVCNYIQKGFKDSLRKFLEGVTSKVPTSDGETVILSPKTFNPDPNSMHTAPLVLAALEGRLGILQLFLEVFKDAIDINHGSYIRYPDLFFLDLQQVQGFKTRGMTALNAACVNGLTDVAKILIQAGANLNKSDQFGYAPLSNAARYGRVETIEYLLRRGANITHKTHDGYTAIHLAAMHGQDKVIEIMLKKMINPLFPNPKQPIKAGVPCPLYLAASKGWQPVVDVLTAHESCPVSCKIDASLLLGAAARMFWRDITPENMKGVVDLWISARSIEDSRENLLAVVCPAIAYGNRKELVKKEELSALFEDEKFEEESLYQCLIIHERCMGSVNSYNWIFLAGMKMFQRKHYKAAEELWKRAMEMHYEIAKQHIGSNSDWQHDLKGCIEYMIQFSSALETMVKNDYIPMWGEYTDYAIQQLKLGILTSRQSNLLDTNAGILKMYYCLLQIFSCWVNKECGQPEIPIKPEHKNQYSETLERAGQSFFDMASVLTQSNLLHILIHPAPPLLSQRGSHWQTTKRLPGLLLAIIDWGSSNSINDLDHHGNRPLHVAAKLPNKALRDALVSILLSSGAHRDALNTNRMTAEEICKQAYPNSNSTFPPEIPRLTCLVATEIVHQYIDYDPFSLPSELNMVLRLHSIGDHQPNTINWITLPEI